MKCDKGEAKQLLLNKFSIRLNRYGRTATKVHKKLTEEA
jgi:hypothetical protein